MTSLRTIYSGSYCCRRMGRIAIVLAVHAAALCNHAEMRNYITAGIAQNIKAESGIWTTNDGYLVPSANGATLSVGDIITTGDFRFTATVRGASFSSNSGTLVINGLGKLGFARPDSASSAGRIIIPANHGSKAHCFYSDDHGQSWQLGNDMPGYGNEVTVAETADGAILMNSRNSSDSYFRKMAMSSDGGATWLPPQDRRDLVEPTCHGAIRSIVTETGENLLLFSNPDLYGASA